MNILYIGHYREANGFGYASKRYIEAIATINSINLAIRPVYLQKVKLNHNLNSIILDAEKQKYNNYDVIIQDTFPDFYEYNRHFGKNICIPKIQTRNLYHTGWIEKINLMDEVWVSSFFSEKSLLESGVIKKIKTIPEPYNISEFRNNIQQKKDSEYNFYAISSLSSKDNLLSLIVAYMLEFDKTDNARLIIKLDHANNYDIDKLMHQAYSISRIKSDNINEPIIINGFLTDDKLRDLHNNSDCYVDVSRCSYNAACCIESCLYNNICICVNNTASSSFITNYNGFNIDSKSMPIISEPMYGIEHIFTTNETWNEPILDSIRQNMRTAYQLDGHERQTKIQHFNKEIFNYNTFHKYLI